MIESEFRRIPVDRIPFVLAATGHRSFPGGAAQQLQKQICPLIFRLRERMPSTPLIVLSALAEGADQLIAEAALHCGVRDVYLVAVLPMPTEVYLEKMSEPARSSFRQLLRQASMVIELEQRSSILELQTDNDACARQYVVLADFLASHCEALIALWDGAEGRGAGGTFDVVRSVLAGVEYKDCMEPLRGTVYHFNTAHLAERDFSEELDFQVLRCPGDLDDSGTSASIERRERKGQSPEKEVDIAKSSLTARHLTRWRLEPRTWLQRKLARARRPNDAGRVSHLRHTLWQHWTECSPAEAGLETFNREASKIADKQLCGVHLQSDTLQEWAWPYLLRLNECYRRADRVARLCQARKRVWLVAILICASLAIVGLETHALTDARWLWFAFPGAIILAVGVHLLAIRQKIENGFLDARVLAEALRVQYFWELGGIHKPVWQHYLVHRPSELGWVISALRGLSLLAHEHPEGIDPMEVWMPAEATEENLHSAVQDWIGDQAKWYASRSRRQKTLLHRTDRAGNLVLLSVVLISLSCGVLAYLRPCLLEGNILHTTPNSWIHWGLALLTAGFGVLTVWQEQESYDEQARTYRRMGHLFAHRKRKIDSILASRSDQDFKMAIEEPVHLLSVTPHLDQTNISERLEKAREVLRELGLRALEENSIWLIMRREHPLRITGGT